MNALPIGLFVLAQQAPPGTWSESIVRLNSEQWFMLTAIALPCLAAIILGGLGIIASASKSIHRRRVETEMKRDMLDRGMSADDIVKVIEAVTPPEDATQRWIASWASKKK